MSDNYKISQIKPRLPGGFRDFLPDEFARRQRMLDVVSDVYRSFGFKPLQTSSVEYFETLAGGDETSKQIYRVFNQEPDFSGESLALRFDLTVSLARMMAANRTLFPLPFKRYQMGEVWRGERQQKGRFRQFLQFDADIVGTASPAADAEIILLMHTTMISLGIKRFTIKINNRKILNGLAYSLGLLKEDINPFLRLLDKLDKIGWNGVKERLISPKSSREGLGLGENEVLKVEDFINLPPGNEARLQRVRYMLSESDIVIQGCSEMTVILDLLKQSGFSEERLEFDPSLARGLDYYTGPVFETALEELPDLGSVMAGGRYDNLVERFAKVNLPATGVSLGVDRLMVGLSELKLISQYSASNGILVAGLGEEMRGTAFRVAHELRKKGISSEVFLGDKMGMKQQLKYADKTGIPYVVIIGPDEWEKKIALVKDMKTGDQKEIRLEKLAEYFS